MKKIIYLFLAIFIVASTQSCSRVGDEDGDLLNNLDHNQGGLSADRFLYQEFNSVDTLAEYHYSGRRLVEVLNPRSKTNIIYNGELINKITSYQIVGVDSTAYTQYLTYDGTAKYIKNISEVGATYKAYKATTPGPILRYKAVHDLTYNADATLKDITTKNGADNPAVAFQYTSYVRNTFTFGADKKNVIKVVRDIGPYTSAGFGAAAQQKVYSYLDYDSKIAPHTLLPFGYNVTSLLKDVAKNQWLSANNPKQIVITDEMIPTPTVLTTNYTYDPLGYMLSGFGRNYDYRPF